MQNAKSKVENAKFSFNGYYPTIGLETVELEASGYIKNEWNF